MPGANTVHLGDQVAQDLSLLHLLGPIFLAAHLMAAAFLLHLLASSLDTLRLLPCSPLLRQTGNQARHDVSKHHMCLQKVSALCLLTILILCSYLSALLLGHHSLKYVIASHSGRQGHTVVHLNTASHVHLVCVASWRSDCRCSDSLSICSMNLSSRRHNISTRNIAGNTGPHTESYAR